MPGKKYLDFTESEPRELECKQAPGKTRRYVSITCPHCDSAFIDIPIEQLTSTKASKCLQHLRVCEAFKAKGGEVALAPERKRADTTNITLMERVQALEDTVSQHNAVFDVLVNDYGMFRPITDQNIRPQITMLLDQSTSSSTAIVTASDAAQMQQHQLLLVQKDSVISEQNLLLAQKDKELELAKADLKRIETEFQDKFQRQDATVKRVQEERDAMESKFRAQLKRQRSGASKSLLSQAQQAQKVHVMKHDLLPKGAGGSSRSE